MKLQSIVVRALTACLVLAAAVASAATNPDWKAPQKPFRIAGNLYYVGSRDLAAYLVVTPAGNILINANLESSPPQIRTSVQALGFRWADTRILLISHAHFDHAAGSAEVLRETGASMMVMQGDAELVETGDPHDFAGKDVRPFPPAHVSRVLHDGDMVALGGTILTAHKTAGHTRGCTTWTMQVREQGQTRNVVIVGSWSVNSEFRLVDAPGRPASYPGIAADYERTFAELKALPCDIFLGAHGLYFDMLGKLARAKAGAGEAVWIDPAGYKAAVAEHEQAFETELKREQAAAQTTRLRRAN